MSEIAFRTKTGSVYVVDNERRTWRRIRCTERSGVLRCDGGRLTAPAKVIVGRETDLWGSPFAHGLGPRLVITTRVVAILSSPASGAAPG